MKELLYNEIYFASVEESNDPYDSKVFLSYDFEQPKWQRLIEAAWRYIGDKDSLSFIIEPLSKQIASDKPITFEEVMSYDYHKYLMQIEKRLDELSALRLSEALKCFIDLYRNADAYFVSFSKKNNEPLMWSHYASRHYGYCLIFKAINNSLEIDMKYGKKDICRDTPQGIAPLTSSPLPSKFIFEDVKYCSDIETIDAARFMPEYITGSVKFASEEERIAYVEYNIRRCLEKHKCWEYECESRLVLREPTPWVYGQHNPLTKQERLFNYKFSQLIGIIFGAKMGKAERERIIDIIRTNRQSLWSQENSVKRIFDFIIFNANISDKSRDVIIEPQIILASNGDIKKGEEKFNILLNEWEQGKAFVFESNNGRIEYL